MVKDEARGMTTFTLLGAFLRDHHPDLLKALFETKFPRTADNPAQRAGIALGEQMADGMITMITDAARERYVASCDTD